MGWSKTEMRLSCRFLPQICLQGGCVTFDKELKYWKEEPHLSCDELTLTPIPPAQFAQHFCENFTSSNLKNTKDIIQGYCFTHKKPTCYISLWKFSKAWK